MKGLCVKTYTTHPHRATTPINSKRGRPYHHLYHAARAVQSRVGIAGSPGGSFFRILGVIGWKHCAFCLL